MHAQSTWWDAQPGVRQKATWQRKRTEIEEEQRPQSWGGPNDDQVAYQSLSLPTILLVQSKIIEVQKKPKTCPKSYKYHGAKIIQPSTHSSIHPPISQPSIHLSFTQLSINIHIHSSSVPHPPTYPSICPFTYSSIHSSIHSSTHLSIHLPIYPLIYPKPYNWQIWIQHWAFHALWPGDTEVNEHKQMPASLSSQEWK